MVKVGRLGLLEKGMAFVMASAASSSPVDRFIDRLEPVNIPFCFELADGSRRIAGDGEPQFRITINNDQAMRALSSLDEGNFAEAYLRGDLDIDGDMLKPFAFRASLDDRHPIVTAWRFVQPLLFGQVYTNKKAISSHYDVDPSLFLSFLDSEQPAYSQGVYESDDETLAVALARKFEYCVRKCALGPGKRVLEIGPGWGAFARYALKQGNAFIGITNSHVSQTYLTEKLSEFGDRSEIILTDFLEYEPDEKFDAIVIMGVIEHLPQYERVLTRFARLLKPGGLVFLDGSAARKKYELSTFMVRHIYPGNHSFLVLHDFIDKLAKSPFELLEVHNDSHSYYLTFKQWAVNLEGNRELIRKEFGDFEYRKFRLYLWGAAYEFLSRNLECYRLILQLPEDQTN
jgi:cyclopropane-fatty-acyl-phospholipid synthase